MTQLFPAAAPDVLYIVDLSSYVLRAYHAIAPLSSPTGEPTHAVHGTVSMLERLVRQCRPALLAIAMDSGRVTFRKEIYDAYKANRPPAPTDLKQQMARCEQIVRAFNIPIFKQDGVEADDLIASAVKRAGEHDLKVVIVAADKDLMPLVSERTIMWDTMRDRVFGVAEVEERFGVRIDQVQDLLALTGDTSDNIPGVPSVGPKTAKDLLVEFGSLQGIYQRIDELKKKGLKDKLVEHKEQAFLSRRLVELKDDCPIVIDQAHLAYGGRDIPALKALYAELGFQRQLQALANEPEGQSSSPASFALQPGSQPASASSASRPAASQAEPAAPGAGRRGAGLASGQGRICAGRAPLHGLSETARARRSRAATRPPVRRWRRGQVRARSQTRRCRSGSRRLVLHRLRVRRGFSRIPARSGVAQRTRTAGAARARRGG